MTYRYRLAFEPDDNGTVLVTSPDFPPLVTYGDDEADAKRHAVDALTLLISSMIDAEQPVPPPCDVGHGDLIALPLLASLKIELHQAMLTAGLDRAELQRRLGWRKEAIDRIFRLSHESRLADIEAAFKSIGREIDFAARSEPAAVV